MLTHEEIRECARVAVDRYQETLRTEGNTETIEDVIFVAMCKVLAAQREQSEAIEKKLAKTQRDLDIAKETIKALEKAIDGHIGIANYERDEHAKCRELLRKTLDESMRDRWGEFTRLAVRHGGAELQPSAWRDGKISGWYMTIVEAEYGTKAIGEGDTADAALDAAIEKDKAGA